MVTAARRAIRIEDVAAFERVSNPVLAPDGRWVVYESTTSSLRRDEQETHLCLAGTDGSGIRRLTRHGTRNADAAFSPDGRRLAFVSNRAFGAQLWLLPMDGGEAARLTRLRHGVSGPPVWAPDGKTLFVLADVARHGTLELMDAALTDTEAREAIDRDRKEWQDSPKRYDWIYYRHDGAGLSRGLVAQLVAIDAATGEARQLTSGIFPVGSVCVSPDGRWAAFVSNRRDRHELVRASDVYRVSTLGGEPERLCADVIAEAIAYSPDGREIALFGHHDRFANASHRSLYTLPADGGGLTDWSGDFPDDLGTDGTGSDLRGAQRSLPPIWVADGSAVLALSARDGRCEVVRLRRPGADGPRPVEVLAGGDRDVYGFATDGRTTLVLAYALPTDPGRIAAVSLADAEAQSRPRPRFAVTDGPAAAPERAAPSPLHPTPEVRLDDSNRALLAELELATPEAFWTEAADGWAIQGWLIRPPHAPQDRQVPVVLEIHGGPHTHFGHAMFHELQLLAARGFAVVYLNPRGSTSYGQAFVDAVRMHYGEKDASDILEGLNCALDRFPFLDRQRVAVTGGSYGGFMTNWLVGHTDRFFAAVSQRSISNWISFYGVSDIGPRFTEMQLGGRVPADLDTLWQASPLAHAERIRTPLLLIHSEEDHRCPIEQAEQLYVCLKRLEREVELVRVPNSGHELSRSGKPSLRVARLAAILDWIESHLPSAGAPAPEAGAGAPADA